jgi:glutamate synthase (NADPH/NADH) large chain
VPSTVATRACGHRTTRSIPCSTGNLIEAAEPALERKRPVKKSFAIHNHDRTVGAMLSGEVAKRYAHAGLPDGTIRFGFTGSAGQSFGAFCARGITLSLEARRTTTSERACRAAD